MKVIFMGTPDFAVPTLEKLHEKGHDVQLVVTQPDKKRGRGKKVSFSPVKEKALEYGIEVFQPRSVNTPESIQKLKDINPDIIIVAAFGQIVSEELLNIPEHGCVNVHASLLPYYRGAAPINWCIIRGEKVAGVTIMMMEKGLDSGDMVLKGEVEIGKEETAGELYDRLKALGGELLVEAVDMFENGTVTKTPQNHELSTYAPMMDKTLGHIDWAKNGEDIKNLVRGTQPWPGCYTQYEDNKIKVFKVDFELGEFKGESGEILAANKDGIEVKCLDGKVIIKELQSPGKRRMVVRDFMAGNSMEIGKILK